MQACYLLRARSPLRASSQLVPAASLAQGTPQRGGTLVMVVQPEPPTLASYQSIGPDRSGRDQGVRGTSAIRLQPASSTGLAQSWTVSPDGKTITFKLQQGVKFHDGKPFTSEDVKFSILDVLKKVHPRGVNTFRAVESIDTPDASTVILRLSEPAPYMLMALSGYESPMLPKHVFGTGDIANHPNANKPVGTGPFKFVEWQKGQYMRFDRNAEYWRQGTPYLDRIVARFIADGATARPRWKRRKCTSAASAPSCRSM